MLDFFWGPEYKYIGTDLVAIRGLDKGLARAGHYAQCSRPSGTKGDLAAQDSEAHQISGHAGRHV